MLLPVPVNICNIEKSFLFGLFKYSIVVNDYRPDLSSEDARLTIGYKYIVKISVYCICHSFNYMVYTLQTGLLDINDVDQHIG